MDDSIHATEEPTFWDGVVIVAFFAVAFVLLRHQENPIATLTSYWEEANANMPIRCISCLNEKGKSKYTTAQWKSDSPTCRKCLAPDTEGAEPEQEGGGGASAAAGGGGGGDAAAAAAGGVSTLSS